MASRRTGFIANWFLALMLLAGCGEQEAGRVSRHELGGMDFALIPAGTFTMGSPEVEPGRRDSETSHEVTIARPFYLAATEVTQEQWCTVAATNPSAAVGPQRPVERICWWDAVEFCNALSEHEGLRPCYEIAGKKITWNRDADGYRLPTEEEWEYACRAGSRDTYHTGACLTVDEANVDFAMPCGDCPRGTSVGTTTLVGSYAPNVWGLYDMHGNVEEWCWNYYRRDPLSPNRDLPNDGDVEPYRCLRGGGYGSSPDRCRSAARGASYTRWLSDQTGLRLARNAPADLPR